MPWLGWILLVLLALLLRWPLLGRSIWFDEACMSQQRLGTTEQTLAVVAIDIHPPLFVVFMHLWNRLFGDRELVLRLPALLTGLASLPALLWVGRLLSDEPAAWFAVLLLSLSPVHIWYSAEARLYAPMVLLTLLLFGSTVRLARSSTPVPTRWWWLHWALVGTSLLLHYYLAVILAVLGALAPGIARGWTRASRSLMLGHGLGLLALGGFVYAKQRLGYFETSQDYLRALDLAEFGKFVIDWCWTGHVLLAGDSWGEVAAARCLQGLGALLLGVGLWRVWSQRRHQPLAWLLPVGLLAIPLFLWCAARLGLGSTYIERACLPSLPFVFLLAGHGLMGLPPRARRVVFAAVLALLSFTLVAFYQRYDSAWTVYKPNSDWRSAAAYLSAEIDAGAAGRPVFTSTPNARPLSYYDTRIQDVKNLTPGADPERLGAAISAHVGAWLGSTAVAAARTLAAQQQALLDGAALRIYRSAGDPAALDLQHRMKDDICYLVRDQWHPSPLVDHTLEDLLAHPRVQRLEHRHFSGIDVYKVRIAP